MFHTCVIHFYKTNLRGVLISRADFEFSACSDRTFFKRKGRLKDRSWRISSDWKRIWRKKPSYFSTPPDKTKKRGFEVSKYKKLVLESI
ncbi:hypothetical protein DLM78_17345 [Leptospira stimsonii]|uniref:Uncharacterized protein n=1 Tax=Leptospira stimsonii TaxID=2202203 RepID=A0A8B3CPM8_9LEPT|nr:hypothetical protein DLM78_17345 [Leptospira stimsonii]